MKIQIKRCGLPEEFPLPAYETAGAAGMDLRSRERVVMYPRNYRQLVPTGITVALPEGAEAQVRPRSGLAHKHGVTVLNAPGTVDADYRGEIKVLLINTDPDVKHIIEPGDRIAQMVIAPVVRAEWEQVDSLDETERGAGGFGSTGV